MKKIIFLIGAIIFLFAGCKKNNADSTNYFKGKIDGVAFDYSKNVSTTPLSISGNNSLYIRAEFGLSSITLRMSQGLGSPIIPGEYIFGANTSCSGTITADQKIYFAGDTFLGLRGSGKITILEISNEYVKGNFEFTTHPDITTNYIVIAVTNGEFRIKRT